MKIFKQTAFLLFAIGTLSASAQTEDFLESGVASYYHNKFVGRKTANGERFSQKQYTCAHKNLPFGTRLRVTNIKNGKSVIVTVNDRGPFTKGRVIDLSLQAATDLDFVREGLTRVAISVDQPDEDTLETIPYLVLNDSIRHLYCMESKRSFSVKVGGFNSEGQLKEIAEQINHDLGREVMVQTISDAKDTNYLVFVGIFYKEDDAKDFLESIENYYPKAEVTELSTASL